MGTVYKRGKRWWINYIDPEGKRVREAVAPYKETAERILHKIEIQIVEGKYLEVRRNQKILFKDFAKEYFDTYVCLENRNPKNQQYVINGLVEYFQGKYLHQITPISIRQFMSQRIKKVKPSSVNKDLTMLKSMFNKAKEWEIFFNNPTISIKKLLENNERCRWLTEEEQECLLFYCKGVTKLIVLIALKTGMRWGEIVNLKWQQSPRSNYVDFVNDTIFIHESLAKSKKSRYVPLAQSVKDALESFPRQQGTDYIFLNIKTGKPLTCIKRSFKTALKKAGIEDLKFHDLRHVFSSQLVRCGVDLYAVQQLLGHSTPKMTQRYAHLRPDHLRNAISQLEKKDCLRNDFMYNKASLDRTKNVKNNTILSSQNL